MFDSNLIRVSLTSQRPSIFEAAHGHKGQSATAIKDSNFEYGIMIIEKSPSMVVSRKVDCDVD